MAVVTRLGRFVWTLGKGGRRLRVARRAAERSSAAGRADGGTARDGTGPEVAARPTAAQAVLLVRFVAGRFLLGWVQAVFLAKYLLLAIAALAWFGFDDTFGTVVSLALFVAAAVVQWLVGRVVRRLGALDELAGLDDLVSGVAVDWWPDLRAELRRVGLDPSVRGILRLCAGHATRRVSSEQRAGLERVDWRAVLPGEQLQEARRLVARAAGESPPPPA